MVVYQCEDSLESIFTAVYRAYEEHRDHANTRICLEGESYLFAAYCPVEADEEKAGKVVRTLAKQFGQADYLALCQALSSADPDKAQAVYQTIVGGLKRKSRPGHLLDNLADEYCAKTFALARNVSRETCHLRGFLRFEELENGILYARIGPRNDVLVYLMPHFADRFPMENFVICDEHREVYGVHPAGGEWYLVRGETGGYSPGELARSESEEQIQELFRQFCGGIAIPERRNPKLQQKLMPLRFQRYAVEFAK